MPDTTHAKFSPSQLPRIIACPGSELLSQGIPETTSVYAEDGTLQHAVVEACLLRESMNVTKAIKEEFGINDAQEDAVDFCLDFVFDLLCTYGAGEESVEAEVSLAPLGEEFADVYGTLDYALAPFNRPDLLVCADWKFGRGVVLPTTAQLKAYGLGKYLSLEPEARKKIKTVEVYIVQPYVDDPVKSHVYTVRELKAWARKELKPALLAARSETPVFGPGEDACRWCKAKGICKSRKEFFDELAAKVFEAHEKLEANKISAEDVAGVLDMTSTLTAYLSSIKDHATGVIKGGGEIPGYKIVEGRSRRIWKGDFETECLPVLTGELGLSEDDLYTRSPLTAPQAEKLDKSLKKNDVFKALIIKPEGSPTLVPESDKRAALCFQTAEDVFADFAQDETDN